MEEVAVALAVSTAVGLVLAAWKPPPSEDPVPEGEEGGGESEEDNKDN